MTGFSTFYAMLGVPRPLRETPPTFPLNALTVQELSKFLERLRGRTRLRPKRKIPRQIKAVLRAEITDLLAAVEKGEAYIPPREQDYPPEVREALNRWSLRQSARRAYRWDWDPTGDPFVDAGSPLLTQKSARALTALPAMWHQPELWTPEEHAQAAVAALWAARWAIEAGSVDTLARYMERLDWLTIREPYDPSPTTRELARAFGHDPRAIYSVPVADLGAQPRLDEWLHHATPELIRRAHTFVRTLPPGPLGLFISETYHSLAEELLTALNGGEYPLAYEWDPETRVLEALMHHNLLPHPASSPAELAGFLQRAAQASTHTYRGYLSPDELHQLARGVGITLVPVPFIA